MSTSGRTWSTKPASTSADVPKTWDEYWDWWCETAQPAVREATGDRNKFGVGQPMSSSASDTIFAYMMFLNAFDTDIVDEQGKLTVDDPKVREGMIKALESYTKPFLDRCVPPGAINWQDSDNNVNFLNKITVMVPNPSLSIPASQKNTSPENYNTNMVTFEWPDKPDGRPIEYMASVKTAVIFKERPNKAAAKEFMKFFLQPEHLGPYLEGLAGALVPGRPAADRHALLEGPERSPQGGRGPPVHAAAAGALAARLQPQAHPGERGERLGQGGHPRRARRRHPGGGDRRADRAHQGGRGLQKASAEEGRHPRASRSPRRAGHGDDDGDHQPAEVHRGGEGLVFERRLGVPSWWSPTP